jgi:hypothetical protein
VTAAPELESPTVFRRASGVLQRASGTGVLLLVRGDERRLLELSGTGAALWQTLAEPRSLSACADLLAKRYGVEPHVVQREISPVVHELTGAGALERVAFE